MNTPAIAATGISSRSKQIIIKLTLSNRSQLLYSTPLALPLPIYAPAFSIAMIKNKNKKKKRWRKKMGENAKRWHKRAFQLNILQLIKLLHENIILSNAVTLHYVPAAHTNVFICLSTTVWTCSSIAPVSLSISLSLSISVARSTLCLATYNWYYMCPGESPIARIPKFDNWNKWNEGCPVYS